MDSERLIELVREYKFLYDLSDKRYGDSQKKDAAWKEIGKRLGCSDKHCKKSWALLRDAFRRSMKKRKEIISEQASGIHKKWKYEDEMSFLMPYFKRRSSLYTTSNKDSQNYCDESLDCLDDDGLVSPADPSPGRVPPDDNSSHTKSAPTTSAIPLKRQRIGAKAKKETPSTVLMKYILENKKGDAADDVEQFFAGISTTVKSFPIRERAIAKARVFEVVSQMEIDILSRPSTSSAGRSAINFSTYDNLSASSCPISQTHTPTPQPTNDFSHLTDATTP